MLLWQSISGYSFSITVLLFLRDQKIFGKLSRAGSGVWMETVGEAHPSLSSVSDGVYILQFSP